MSLVLSCSRALVQWVADSLNEHLIHPAQAPRRTGGGLDETYTALQGQRRPDHIFDDQLVAQDPPISYSQKKRQTPLEELRTRADRSRRNRHRTRVVARPAQLLAIGESWIWESVQPVAGSTNHENWTATRPPERAVDARLSASPP